MLMLIWKNISRRRNQSLLTVAITMVTILVFVMVLGVFQTVTHGLELSRERLGADAVLVPKYAPTDSSELLFTASPQNIYMDKTVLDDARQLSGIAAMTPQFYAQTLELSCCEPGEAARIIGYDSASDFILKPYLPEEHRGIVGEKELVMGANFEDDNLVGYNYLILGQKCKVISLLEPTGSGMDSTIFIQMDTLRQMCLESEVLSADWTDKDPFSCISVIMIKLEENVDPLAFQRQVEASGIDAKCILTGDTISSLQSQLEIIMQVVFALWLASLVIAALSLIGRFSALAKERKKEIGLLRALGLRKSQVFGLVIGEACTMALIGGALGSGIALMGMKPVIAILKDAFKLSPSVFSPTTALLCAASGILLALALGFSAAIVPAVNAASMDPQSAITQGEVN